MPTIYNKVVLDGTTLMDISDTTATASDVAQGKYFYTTAGVKTEGTAVGGGNAISIVDTTDSHGGTIRTITAVDISDTTAIASDVASGKYFYTANGTKTLGTASGSGSGGTGQTATGTVTGDGTNVLEIPCNFAPDLIYVYGDMSGDVANQGIVSLMIIKDVAIYTSNDTSASTTNEYATVLHDITGYNESDTSDIHATYSNNTLTINTVTNSSSARWRSGQVYNYELSTIGTGGGSSSPTLVTKEITSNGTYTASNDSADGYSSVTVNVPSSGITPTGSINITTNGTHDVTNYASAVVSVSNGGSTPSATKHTIHFDFSDETDTDIDVYYNDALLATMIQAYTPTAYGQKTVILAQLDGVTWYEPTNIPLNTQLVDYNAVLTGYTINNDGSITTSDAWNCVTDYIPINPTMTFSFKCRQYANIGFYDKNKNPISPAEADEIKESVEDYTAFGYLTPSIIPLRAAYVVLSGNTYGIEDTLSLIRTA